MSNSAKNYVPALRFNSLTRFYDPLVRVATKELSFKSALLARAGLADGQLVLDLACGTGTLSVAIKSGCPGTRVFAFDIDGKILRIARAKAAAAEADVNFGRGRSGELPFPDLTFDRVFSTLSFHHLTLSRKTDTIREILRVLKPGGQLHLADYGLPANWSQKVLSNIVRLIDGRATTADNISGRLGVLLEQNGFAKVERTGHFTTVLGTIRLFRASR